MKKLLIFSLALTMLVVTSCTDLTDPFVEDTDLGEIVSPDLTNPAVEGDPMRYEDYNSDARALITEMSKGQWWAYRSGNIGESEWYIRYDFQVQGANTETDEVFAEFNNGVSFGDGTYQEGMAYVTLTTSKFYIVPTGYQATNTFYTNITDLGNELVAKRFYLTEVTREGNKLIANFQGRRMSIVTTSDNTGGSDDAIPEEEETTDPATPEEGGDTEEPAEPTDPEPETTEPTDEDYTGNLENVYVWGSVSQTAIENDSRLLTKLRKAYGYKVVTREDTDGDTNTTDPETDDGSTTVEKQVTFMVNGSETEANKNNEKLPETFFRDRVKGRRFEGATTYQFNETGTELTEFGSGVYKIDNRGRGDKMSVFGFYAKSWGLTWGIGVQSISEAKAESEPGANSVIACTATTWATPDSTPTSAIGEWKATIVEEAGEGDEGINTEANLKLSSKFNADVDYSVSAKMNLATADADSGVSTMTITSLKMVKNDYRVVETIYLTTSETIVTNENEIKIPVEVKVQYQELTEEDTTKYTGATVGTAMVLSVGATGGNVYIQESKFIFPNATNNNTYTSTSIGG